MFTASDLKGKPGKELFGAVGFGEVLYAEDFPSALDAGREDQVHVVFDIDRLFEDFCLLKKLFTALSSLDRLFAVEAP